MTRRKVVVVAHCTGKEKHTREQANARARAINNRPRHKSKRGKVNAYQCQVCDTWHIGSD